MFRKKAWDIFRRNVDWVETQEDSNLIIPAYHLFCPNLSKSAPCGCCGGSGCTDCTCCRNVWPRLKLSDSLYGGWFTFNVANTIATNSVASITGTTDCTPASPTIGTVTATLTYSLSCNAGSSTGNRNCCVSTSPGYPAYFALLISYNFCCFRSCLCTPSAGGSVCSSNIGQTGPCIPPTNTWQGHTVDCVPIISSLNCSSPNWTFTIEPTSGNNPYNSGASINVVPN